MNILNDVTLTLFSGDIVALIGDNGCGKTTFLELIAVFLRFNRGLLHTMNRTKSHYPSFRVSLRCLDFGTKTCHLLLYTYNIETVVEKYNGIYYAEQTENMYCASVFIPI